MKLEEMDEITRERIAAAARAANGAIAQLVNIYEEQGCSSVEAEHAANRHITQLLSDGAS